MTGQGPAHLLHVFPTFAPGGVQIRMSRVFGHLGPRFRHTIVATDNVFTARSRLSPALDVRFLPLDLPKERGLRNLPRIRRELRAIAPDRLLTYNWGSIEWALANRIRPLCPHIHLESGFGPEEAAGQITRRVLMRRLALARTQRIVVPSRTLLDIAVRAWRIPRNRLVHIPNGVDCERFRGGPGDEPRREGSRDPGPVVVGTVTPLRPEKNLTRLIRAFAALGEEPGVILRIAGDGPEEPALRARAASEGVDGRVQFLGHVEDAAAVYAGLDVYAISSDTEQMPNSLLEAMAAGLPVAGTDVGDVRSLVAEENRPWITPRGNDDAFAASLRRLVADASLRAELGTANRRHVRAEYSQEKMYRAYEELLAL